MHWLLLSAPLEFKILVLVLKSKLGVASKYLMDHIHSTLSATSHRPLHSSDWHVLFVLQVRTVMTQTRSICNHWALPLECPPFLSSLNFAVSGSRSASLSLLKTYFYSRGLCTGSATEWSLL